MLHEITTLLLIVIVIVCLIYIFCQFVVCPSSSFVIAKGKIRERERVERHAKIILQELRAYVRTFKIHRKKGSTASMASIAIFK